MLGVLVPAANHLLEATRGLDRTLRELLQAPMEARLAEGRRAFSESLRAWRRASAFRAGPFGESKAFLQAAFWPARSEAIDAVLASAPSVDARLVAGLGVDRRGLFALEYVLFGQQSERALLEDTRRLSFSVELSKNILGYAERLARLLGDGRDYLIRLKRSEQSSIHELVAQTVDSSEILIGKIRRIERAKPGEALPRLVEAYHAGLSRELALELLAGTRALYDEGLGKLVELTAPAVHERVNQRFTLAERHLDALARPLDQALSSDPRAFTECASALKALELALKLEMANALGVSLVFSGVDGD